MVDRHRELRLKILRYLDRNPDAQDTVEGITQWWLLEQQLIEEISAVQAALDELVADELVKLRWQHGVGPQYSVDRTKRARISDLLAEDESPI